MFCWTKSSTPVSIDVVNRDGVSSFTNLDQLTLHEKYEHKWEEHGTAETPELASAALQNVSMLAQLSTFDSLARNLPTGFFSNLRALELIIYDVIYTLSYIHVADCERLQDLSLIFRFVKPSPPDRFLSIFLGGAGSLPLLTSFRLDIQSCSDRLEWEPPYTTIFDKFFQVLRNRPNIRRLSISPTPKLISDVPDPASDPSTGSVVELLPTLPSLTVFSYAPGADDEGALSVATLGTLHRILPPDITAFGIKTSSVEGLTPWNALVLCHTVLRRKSLRYLHIILGENEPETPDLTYVEQQLLDDPPPSLELFGYGKRLRWRVREERPDAEPLWHWSPPWSECKVAFLTEADYGDADWYWITKNWSI
ncbi:uncharacterized protein BXZ73DRAFT_102902 [Epithele typhae]|uniref:uncharacterized protein n=1 Tax=Epithele typhae TaxID=378194 RepID=UPI002007A9D9|nr:uncharacterized protein BXZ73DRAFT_102902 [Epithele typhae]KAH9926646.1 hypothetical protein BXZ73DRAFT_102902 [Epithele typhae]